MKNIMESINNMLESEINKVLQKQNAAEEVINEDSAEEVISEEVHSDDVEHCTEISEDVNVSLAACEHDILLVHDRLNRIEEVLVTLTESHDSLCANIQSAILESMQAAQIKTRRKSSKVKHFSDTQEEAYKVLLAHFTESTGKTQRDLTNGVNQLIASSHGYSVGKPSNCAASEHILAKVAKDYEIDSDKYLSVDGYIENVRNYIQFITQSLPSIPIKD